MGALFSPEILQAGAVKGLITLNFVVSIARSIGKIDFFVCFNFLIFFTHSAPVLYVPCLR